MCVPLITAKTPHSCGVACIVSLLQDLKSPLTQEDIFKQFAPFFPEWQNRLGYLNGADFITLIQLLKINCNLDEARDPQEVRNKFDRQECFAAFVGTKFFYGENSVLEEINHCLRVVRTGDTTLQVMNPCGGVKDAEIQTYTWSQFLDWEALVLFLSVPSPTPTNPE